MINIMYVVYSFGIGGLEKCVADLVNGIDKKKFYPMICCLTTSGASAEKITYQHIEIFEMNKKPGHDITLPLRLASLFRKKRVDIVHSGNWGTMVEAYLGAKIARVPKTVHVEHGMELDDFENISRFKIKLRNLSKFFFSHGITHFISVSNDLKEYIQQTTAIKSDKIFVIYNGVDVQKYRCAKSIRKKVRANLGLKNCNILIGSVGRLAEVKNYSCLIMAMKKILDKCPEARLIIVGDGPLKEKLRAKIDKLMLSQFVWLLGERKDIPQLLAAMDIYALPSIFEGISISILEAMSAGLAVVATNVGGNPEIIIDGKTGFLVPPRNDDVLSQKLIELILDQKKRTLFSTESAKRVNEVFHKKTMVSAYSKLYLKI